METWVVLNDMQIPFQDKPVIDKLVLPFIRELQPHGIVLNGDVVDMYTISDFSKNPLTPASLVREVAEAKGFMMQLADIPQKVWVGGNHEDRLRRYLWKHAPALGVLPELDFPQLFHLGEYGFKWLPYGESYYLGKLRVTHGWLVSKHSAYSARAHWEEVGENILVGHTHRLGQYYKTQGTKTYVAFENGCLCRLDPEYKKHPNWQQGFAVVHVDPRSGFFNVQQIPILSRKCFYYGGQRYG